MSESLRSIQVFVATYEERSFTAAAKREHATQSGVSQHIRKLEDRLGVKLFSRDRGRVVPTPAGDAYYERCVELLRLANAADSAASRFGGGLTGEIVVGLMPTMTRSALAPALSRFTDEQPNVAIRVVEGYSAVLTQQVRAGRARLRDRARHSEHAGHPQPPFPAHDRAARVADENRACAISSRCACENLGPLRLVVPGPQNTRRRSIETYLAANGLRCERVLELDAMLGTLDLVSRSDWVTILPGIMMAADIERPAVTINPIVDPVFTLDLVLIEPSRRGMSPAARSFLEMLQVESETARRALGALPCRERREARRRGALRS